MGTFFLDIRLVPVLKDYQRYKDSFECSTVALIWLAR